MEGLCPPGRQTGSQEECFPNLVENQKGIAKHLLAINFSCHEIAEGHIESYQSVFMCVFVHLCIPESCTTPNFILHGGIDNV